MRNLAAILAIIGYAASAAAYLESQPFSQPDYDFGFAPVTVLNSENANPVAGSIFSCRYGNCVYNWEFRVDLAVANLAFQKDVAVVYTTDAWKTTKEVKASYLNQLQSSKPLPNTFERWSVVVPLGQNSTRPVEEIEYYVVGKMLGKTYFDPRSQLTNYAIYKKASPTTPVKLASSKIAYTASSGAEVAGVIRAWNFNTDYSLNNQNIFVRYSVDDWKTFKEARAAYDAALKAYRFRVTDLEGVRTNPVPADIKFAVRYDYVQSNSAKQEWDNNGQSFNGQAQNFRHVFLAYEERSSPFNVTVNGVYNLGGSFSSELPFTRAEQRFDSAPFVPTTFPEGFAVNIVLDTQNFTAGPHSFDVRAKLVGAPTPTVIKRPFTVQNKILRKSTWLPAVPAVLASNGRPATWDAAIDKNGKVYVNWDQQAIARYSSFGTPALPEAVFNMTLRAWTFAVDDAGNVYATDNSNAVVKYLPTGAVDTAFNLQLSTLTTDGVAFNFAGALSTNGKFVVVVDNPHARVWLVSTTNGSVLGTFRVTAAVSSFDYYGTIDTTYIDPIDGTLWVSYAPYPETPRLLQYNVANPAAPVLIKTIIVDQGIGSADGIARVGDKIFVSDDSTRSVAFLSTNGGKIAQYSGDGANLALASRPGLLSLVRRVFATTEAGVFAAISAEGGSISTFKLA